MADPQSAVPEASHPTNTGPTQDNTAFPPFRRGTCSSESSGPYQPLPEGHWIIPFHGTCPKCSHHHSAAEVKIKVTQDVSQVSRVDCENCKETWAAFGGRNATMISLLSDTTTEPDPMEKEVRLHLIDVVMMAKNAASLGTLKEQPSRPSTHEQSIDNSARDVPHETLPSPEPSDPAIVAEAETPTQLDHHRNPSGATRRLATACPASTDSSTFRRHLKTLKKKLTKRVPILHMVSLKRLVTASKQPTTSIEPIEKSSAQTPPARDERALHEDLSPAFNTHESTNRLQAAQAPLPSPHVPEPATQFVEVANFFRSLDKSGLESMSDKQRAAWMRKHYSEFKARNRRHQARLSISEVFQTSIQYEPPRLQADPLNRRSVDFYATGAHLEGLDRIRSNSPARRWGSISISDVFSEADTARDDLTVASFPRYSRQEPLQRVHGARTQRPLSLPHGTTRSLPHFRQRIRYSLPAFWNNRPGSTSTTRGQASVRWSQGSTPGPSPLGIHDFATQESLNHPVN